MFDEQTRLEQRRWPQDLESWGTQIARMSLFAELVHDTDRHGGNVLYTSDWKLFMIDFTRAFSVTGEMLWPYRLVRVDRQVFARLGVLTATEMGDATRPHLGEDEVEAVIQRRSASETADQAEGSASLLMGGSATDQIGYRVTVQTRVRSAESGQILAI